MVVITPLYNNVNAFDAIMELYTYDEKFYHMYILSHFLCKKMN